MVKTKTFRAKGFPLNPTPPNPPPVKKTRKSTRKPSSNRPTPAGDLALAKTAEKERKDDGQSDQVARATSEKLVPILPAGSQLPGPKMKQDGGVHGGET